MADYTAFERDLRDLRERATSLDARRFLAFGEDGDFEDRVVEPLHTLLEETLTWLEETEQHATKACGSTDGGPAAEASLHERLADTCFGARIELRELQDRMKAQGPEAREEMVDRCEHVCSRIRRSLAAVAAECTTGTTEPPSSTPIAERDELENALALRRLYAQFRRRCTDAARSAESPNAQRSAVTELAIAISGVLAHGDHAYIRLRDRRIFLQLQQRMIRSLGGEAGSEEPRRLLDDTLAFVELLRGINERQELVDHDRRLIAALLDGEGSDETLDALWGRDDVLDGLLDVDVTDAAQVDDRTELIRARLEVLVEAPLAATP